MHGPSGHVEAEAGPPSTGALIRDANLQTIFAVSLVAVLAVPTVTPVFPRLAEELGVGGGQIGLIITAFSLPGMILAPFLGMLADRLGRKRVLVPSLLLFALAGTTCAFVRDFHSLLLLRALQGVGGAALGSVTVTLIADRFQGEARASAMGLNGSFLSIGAALYPTLGGLAGTIGTYYPFAFAAVALPVALLVLTRLSDTQERTTLRVRDQFKGLGMSLLRAKVAVLFLAGILTGILFYGTYLTYLTLMLGQRFGATPAEIGLITACMPASFALSASQFRRVSRVLSPPATIATSFLIYAVAVALMPMMPTQWALVVPVMLFGLAHGVNVPAQQVGLVELAPQVHRAAFMSLNTTIIRGGQTVGPVVVGVAYVAAGLTGTFVASALVAAGAALVGWTALARRGANRPTGTAEWGGDQ